MAAPSRSCIIWFSQRTGSTLLAQALEDTGIAGRPREWLNAASAAAVLDGHGATTALELRDRLWREGTTPNGVMGLKYGMTQVLHEDLTALFTGCGGWEGVFPHARHLFMTRRNKIRLAVSWWRAIQSGEWHRPNRSAPLTSVGPASPATPPADLRDRYDYGAIDHLFVEASLREVAMQEIFERWGVVPQTIVYEDFIAEHEATVRRALAFLEIPGRDEVAITAPAFDRLADDVTEAWYQRFHAERRAKLGSA